MFYYVINTEENGKYYAYAWKVEEMGELISEFEPHKNAKQIMPVKTFKRAKEIADTWNKAYKENGTSMF